MSELCFVFWSHSNATDTAQLAILFCGVDEKFKIIKEYAAFVPLKDTKKATDLFTAVESSIKMRQLKINTMS